MAPNAFDNTSRGQSEIQTPSTQTLDMNHLSGGERNVQKLSATMTAMENVSTSSMHLFPDLEIHDSCSTAPTDSKTQRTPNAPTDTTAPAAPASPAAPTDGCNSTPPTDATTPAGRPGTDAHPTTTDSTQTQTHADNPADNPAQPGDQSWKSHLNDQWVKDSLKNNPDWHAMEGLHPGEIAVGNWEPTKEEKKVIGSAVDKMMAEHNDGPCFVTLPDGSVCTIEIVRGGQGQSFSKGKDNQDAGGKKHRKVSFGRPAPDDDSDSEVCGGETEETSANPMNQVQVA